MICIESIELILKSNNIKYIRDSVNSEEFKRRIYFKDDNGNPLVILWFSNIGYLKVGKDSCTMIPFTGLDADGTWPNQYKLSLKTFYQSKELVTSVTGLIK